VRQVPREVDGEEAYSPKNPPSSIEAAESRKFEVDTAALTIQSSLDNTDEHEYYAVKKHRGVADVVPYELWRRNASFAKGMKEAESKYLHEWLAEARPRQERIRQALERAKQTEEIKKSDTPLEHSPEPVLAKGSDSFGLLFAMAKEAYRAGVVSVQQRLQFEAMLRI
jgi:hypothetical protein